MSSERRKCLGILGLHEGASEDEVKKAYKKLALQYHPDKNSNEDAKGKFQEIGYAYKYLIEGPSAFETTNPHDVREEFLRRMFEEMFFTQFSTFFCANDSDEDEYYMYHDSSDDNTYYQSAGTDSVYDHTRRAYQNTYPRYTAQHQNYPQVSKKQLRKREKRQRQKERAKERKEQTRNEKKETKNMYTDDINPEPKKKEHKPEPTTNDNTNKTYEGSTDAGNSRPDTPVLNQQSQKPNKKQKKKMESEQKKREREMQEIAAELMEKQERQKEKQKEKERIAAQKKEQEDKGTEINFNHLFDTGKKSRKARQREKKRQESSAAAGRGDNSSSNVPSQKTVHHINSTSNKKKTGESISKTQEQQKRTTKKPAMPGNRFDILDDIEDDIIRPLSRTSISSSDSVRNSQTYNKQHFQYTEMNQNNSNSYNKMTGCESSEIDNEGYSRNGNDVDFNQNRKSMNDNLNCRRESQTMNKSLPDNVNGLDEFDGGEERQFVEDWSVYQSDEEDYMNDWTQSGSHENGWAQSGSNENGWTQSGNHENGWSQSGSHGNLGHHGYGTNITQDKFRNGNNGLKHVRGAGMNHPQGFQKRTEFIPRTRGYHSNPYNSYYNGPQQWMPPYPRGSAPFTRGGDGRYPYPHRPPHFSGGYQARPPFRGRNGGYSGPRYGPPYGMPAYGNAHPFDSPVPFGGHFYGREEKTVNSDIKRNSYMQGNNGKQFSAKKSFKNNKRMDQDVKSGHIQSDFQPDVVKSSASETATRVSSPQLMSWQNIKHSDKKSHLSGDMFCDFENNQASRSSGTLDSIDDDFVNCETNQASDKENTMEIKSSAAGENRSCPYVDIGIKYLSKDSLGVPSEMFSDSIKNYYN